MGNSSIPTRVTTRRAQRLWKDATLQFTGLKHQGYPYCLLCCTLI